jgi:hypothetical protein
VFVPLNWPKRIVLSVLVVFQFSHQIGIVLLLGAAIAAAFVSVRDREMRRELMVRCVILTALAIAAVWKVHLFPDSYAEREFGLKPLMQRFYDGVSGLPLLGLAFMWLSAGVMMIDAHLVRFDPPRTKRRFAAVVLASAAVGGLIWIVWACQPHLWWKALDYRRWLVPLTLPFFTLALLEAALRVDRHDREPTAIAAVRSRLGLLLAVIFAVVLLIQNHEFLSMGDRLMAEVQASPAAVVPYPDAEWFDHTCFDHWGSSAYVMVRQGMTPDKWLLDPQEVAGLREYPNAIPLCWFTFIPPDPGPEGWYDLRGVHRDLCAYQQRVDGQRKGSGTGKIR